MGRLELGPAPRSVFPLVLVFVSKDSDGATGGFNPVTGMLAVLHLKDSVCHIPSQVLATYLRRGDSVIQLRQLYLPEQGAESSDTESAAEEAAEDLEWPSETPRSVFLAGMPSPVESASSGAKAAVQCVEHMC